MRYAVVALCLLPGLASPVYSQEVPRDAWSAHMESLVPSLFCKDDGYFRSCFRLSPSQCNESATRFTADCLAQYERRIPDVLRQPGDGNRWGQVVGSCAGVLFEAEHEESKILSDKCMDARQWQ